MKTKNTKSISGTNETGISKEGPVQKPGFTPGPWTIEVAHRVLTNVSTNEETRRPYYEIGSDLRVLAKVDTGLNDKANAALIAAAPDLYAACEIVLNNLTVMIPANEDLRKLGEKACIDALIAALNKARGES